MTVAELKEELKKYNTEQLVKLIVELYKKVPKRLKEDDDIDGTIKNAETLNAPKAGKQTEKPDITELRRQVSEFVTNAMAQNYFAPNRIVPKTKRSKWRFEVKNYINLLTAIPVDSEGGKEATELLKELYNTLSYGCNYWIFTSDDPFRSVQINQCDFLDAVISRKLREGMTETNLKYCIDVMINSNVDRETLHSDLLCTFINNLKITDTKEKAVEILKKLKTEIEINLQKPPVKKYYFDNHEEYKLKEKIRNIAETVLRLCIKMYECENGIEYFNKNYIEKDEGISKYVLFKILEEYDLKNEWITEYESSVKRIKLRESLQKTYSCLKNNNTWGN